MYSLLFLFYAEKDLDESLKQTLRLLQTHLTPKVYRLSKLLQCETNIIIDSKTVWAIENVVDFCKKISKQIIEMAQKAKQMKYLENV